jgi:DNA-binding MarR family transcriptional regulator
VITAPQQRIVECLRGERTTVGQLSKALSMDASQVKTMLTEMERLKLLWRQYRMIDRRVYEIWPLNGRRQSET